MNILITGGTGFVGRSLIQNLSESGQHRLYGLARSDKAAASLQSVGVKAVIGSLDDGARLKRVLATLDLDIVIHLAAEIASQRNKKLLHAVNVAGTQNLFEAVRELPTLKRFLFVSTVVTGEAHGQLLEEHTELNVETEYGRTKQESERMLLSAFSDTGFPVVICRPCHIYGNGGWLKEIAGQIREGKARIPGAGDNLWDVVHVQDVASALALLMEQGQDGEIYHVADDHPVALKDFFEEVTRILGARKAGHVPRFIANWMIGKDTITSVVRSARTSNIKLKDLGWSPGYPEYKKGLTDAFSVQPIKGKIR